MTNVSPSGLSAVPAAEAPQSALVNAEQIRWLKRAIVIMTALLVAGIVVLAGRVIYLARAGGTQAANGASGVYAQPVLLPEARLALPAGAEIRSMTLSGSRLAVEHTGAGSSAITVLDLATGQVVSRVTVTRGAAN